MKIVVLVSQTPDTTTKIVVAGDSKSIEETGITWILNPYSEFAIEKALKLKEANEAKVEEIILLAMGPERCTEALRQGLAMGADRAILIKSNILNTQALADAVKETGAQLILGGKKTIDTESAWAESAVAGLLDLPMVHCANKLEWAGDDLLASRELSGELQSFKLALPALVTCDKGNDEPRYASIMGIMKAKKKPIDEKTFDGVANLGIEIVSAQLPPARGQVKIFDGSADEAAEKLLRALREEAKVL
ncbi:MAG: electron transfer flavoprotein subunit beta/FixA family protein [Candidatus Caenarcaniphilales bacterium]|jgi:electron transfer flavoprotein beta subunit|nr:electron transfer flavoprotein subunit beta/FixA family protein [Candidatus Caenarcaniphilales bacterium]